jgi:hypothetical protein
MRRFCGESPTTFMSSLNIEIGLHRQRLGLDESDGK